MSSFKNNVRYLICEKDSFSVVFKPLKTTNRIKYTCFEVSQNFLIFGATSGGLYIFKRDPCIFLQLIPNKEGPINNISLSGDEKFIAFSSERGVTCILQLYDDGAAGLISRSLEHCGSKITSLLWANGTNQLYVGDRIGRLSVINVSLSVSKNIFQVPAYVFMQLDSAIVQVSSFEEYLLVSTETRCYICDTTKEQYKQIGTKLRDGLYGASFLNSTQGLKIYCARPGSRIWEADITGNVLNTHNFRKALATESVVVIKPEEDKFIIKSKPFWPDQSLNFCILSSFLDKFLFTYKRNGLYIFDPLTADVVLWSDHYQNIVSAKCVNDTIYIWTSSGLISAFTVTPLHKCLLQLYFLGKFQLCLNLFEVFFDQIQALDDLSKLSSLVGLKEHIPKLNENKKLNSFFNLLIKVVQDREVSTRLDSGIFLVQNKHWKKWKKNVEYNKKSVKNEIKRSKSFSALNNSGSEKNQIRSLKKGHLSWSLSQLQLTVDVLNELPHSKNHERPTSPLGWNYAFSSSLLQQIPFLSLTSPDILQSTILELGQHVTYKLCNSTKSLYDKWQILEGKLKFSTHFYNSQPLNNEFNNRIKSSDGDEQFGQHFDENIVHRQSSLKKQKHSKFDASEICKLCEECEKEENNELLFQLLNCIVKKFTIFKNGSKDKNMKKSFPFNKLIPYNYLIIIQKLFHKVLKTTYILKYLQEFRNTFKQYFTENYTYPKMFIENNKEEDLLNDVSLKNLLMIFSEILDPFTILQCLDNSVLPCTFMSWNIVLDIFQDSAFNYITAKDSYSSLKYSDWPLPLLLNVLFLMFRLDQVESCCHMTSEVNLKLHHVSYLILKLCLHLESTGIKPQNCEDKCNKLLLSYIVGMMRKNVSPRIEIENETVKHIEHAFFYTNRNSKAPYCKCKYPLIGCNKFSFKYSEVGTLLIMLYLRAFKEKSCEISSESNSNDASHKTNHTKKVILTDFLNPGFENIPQNVKKECYKIVELIQTMPDLINIAKEFFCGNVISFVPYLVQFGKLDLLSDVKIDESKFWEKVCDLNSNLSKGVCCICAENSQRVINVDWNILFIMMFKSLRYNETFKLILKFQDDISHDHIDLSFYRVLILSNFMSSDKEHFSLEIDTYYKNFKNFNGKLVQQDFDLAQSRPLEDFRNMDDSKNVKIDLDSDICNHCSHLLRPEKFDTKKMLRRFTCGHIYHKECLILVKSLLVCPFCIVK